MLQGARTNPHEPRFNLCCRWLRHRFQRVILSVLALRFLRRHRLHPQLSQRLRLKFRQPSLRTAQGVTDILQGTYQVPYATTRIAAGRSV